MLSTVKAAVSWLMLTLTRPSLAAIAAVARRELMGRVKRAVDMLVAPTDTRMRSALVCHDTNGIEPQVPQLRGPNKVRAKVSRPPPSGHTALPLSASCLNMQR